MWPGGMRYDAPLAVLVVLSDFCGDCGDGKELAMKITLDIPDTTLMAIFSYVTQEPYTMRMAARGLDSNDRKDGALIKVQPEGENGNE